MIPKYNLGDVVWRATVEEAQAAAAAMAVQWDADERAKIATKERDTRTWAWNASWHRGRIKDLERELAYHTSKLAVAAIKAKEKTA